MSTAGASVSTEAAQGDLLELAEQLRDEGMAQATEADRDGWDAKTIDQAIDHFAKSGRPFSANTLRDLLPEVRQPLIGIRIRAASARGQIVRTGSTPSTLPSTHAHHIGVYTGAPKAHVGGPGAAGGTRTGLTHPEDCPECRVGRHANCTGWAIDPDTDEVRDCGCAQGGHA